MAVKPMLLMGFVAAALAGCATRPPPVEQPLPPPPRTAQAEAVSEVAFMAPALGGPPHAARGASPHTGCDKFTTRFGSDATKWLNTAAGRELRLRGVNARIITGGVVRRGDSLRRL